MTDAEKRENAVNGLQILRTWCAVNPDYGMGLTEDDCKKAVLWLDYALALLKAQEPRVMTLDDAINSEMVWTECSNGDGGYGTCRLVEIYGMVAAEVFMLKNKYPERNRLNPEKYLREWRCWTSSPTKELRETTPWEVADK